jgi:hypothetical protein
MSRVNARYSSCSFSGRYFQGDKARISEISIGAGVKRQTPKTKIRVVARGKPLSVRYAELLKLRQVVLKAQLEKEYAHDRIQPVVRG